MTQVIDQTVLIVDDMPTNVEVLAGALMKAGYQVAVALDGESAIAQIQYKSPALILLDVMMPGIDGFETCRRLKASPDTQDIPIIFMTALSEPVSKAKGFDLGAVDYITKPFEAEEVLARVKTHLRLHQLTVQLEQEVEKRTAELTTALADLQQAHTQLIQSERMSLVGELSAGVAFEISNPVNYIRGNLSHLTTYCTQLLQFAEAAYSHLPSSEERSETDGLYQIADTMLDLDLPFVREDLPKILKSFNRGTDKIQQLVSDLRTFATADKAGRKKVNSHELIDSCLMLLGHKLQAKKNRAPILIRKDYQPTSQIECYPAALSQAVIGILLSYINHLERFQDKLDDAADELSQSTTLQIPEPQIPEPQNSVPQISVQTTCQAEGWTTISLSIELEGVFSDDVSFSKPAALPQESTQTSLLSHPDDVNLILAQDIVCNQHKGRCHLHSASDKTTVTIEIPTVLTSSELAASELAASALTTSEMPLPAVAVSGQSSCPD
ncbi:MAG: response regulator [Cyanobacteria bacterium P01_F01_bin.53]